LGARLGRAPHAEPTLRQKPNLKLFCVASLLFFSLFRAGRLPRLAVRLFPAIQPQVSALSRSCALGE
jgi:hypothetical protein